jgi:acetyl esterase/lipase
VFAAREKNESTHRITIAEVKTGRVRVVAEGTSTERTNVSPFWAQREDWIYFNDFAWSFTDANVMRVRPTGAELENLTPHSGDAVYKLAGVTPKGDQVLVSSDANNGWRNVALIETRSRAIRWITSEPANFGASGFSRDGLIAFTRDLPTETHIFVHDPRDSSTRQLTRFTGMHEPAGRPELFTRPQPSPFSPDGTRLMYVKQSSTAAPELATAKVAGGLEETIVANRLPSELARAVVPATPVWFKSSDGRFTIPALVWIPPNLERNGTHPAVVHIHGGPMDQTRPYLSTYIQVLASQGYLVISPNYRGSTGYDRDFFVANRMDAGGGDLQDVVAAADWLAATGYVNPKKIAVYGASNGAYLTLMAVAKMPERWAAGVALVPFVDFATGYASEVAYLQAVDRALMGDPERDAALWRDRSPLHFANRITAPLMMTASANDPRCPPEQARQMERTIRGKGGIVELTFHDDQAHGAVQTAAYAEENARIVRFMDRHVRDRAVKASPSGK